MIYNELPNDTLLVRAFEDSHVQLTIGSRLRALSTLNSPFISSPSTLQHCPFSPLTTPLAPPSIALPLTLPHSTPLTLSPRLLQLGPFLREPIPFSIESEDPRMEKRKVAWATMSPCPRSSKGVWVARTGSCFHRPEVARSTTTSIMFRDWVALHVSQVANAYCFPRT